MLRLTDCCFNSCPCYVMCVDGRNSRRRSSRGCKKKNMEVVVNSIICVCVCCVFFPFILDIKFVGRTSRGHTGGSSRMISHPSFCGACLNFSRENDSAIPFPRRP